MVKDITEVGRRKTKPFLVPTHDFNTARLFANAVDDLKPPYDLVLATGDLTADGEPDSFDAALQFFQGGSICVRNPNRTAIHGLHAGQGDRLLLPGNHDRFGNNLGQKANALFEEVFTRPTRPRTSYPYVIGYRPRMTADDDDSNPLTLLFFVFDSNLCEAPASLDVPGRIRSIARGEVTDQDLRDAFHLAQDASGKSVVQDLYGRDLKFDPGKTIRIAALHHHPVTSEEMKKERDWTHPVRTFRSFWKEIDQTLMAMEGQDEFLAGCLYAGIQLVLFGHEHDAYYRVAAKKGFPVVKTPFGEMPAVLHCFCCPSTLECEASANGFYIFDFWDEKRLLVDLFLSERDADRVSMPFFAAEKKRRSIDLSKPDQSAKNVKWIESKAFEQAPRLAQSEAAKADLSPCGVAGGPEEPVTVHTTPERLSVEG